MLKTPKTAGTMQHLISFVFYLSLRGKQPTLIQTLRKQFNFLSAGYKIYAREYVLKHRRTAGQKDGGIFNGTVYIHFALRYKNALRIKHQDEIFF